MQVPLEFWRRRLLRCMALAHRLHHRTEIRQWAEWEVCIKYPLLFSSLLSSSNSAVLFSDTPSMHGHRFFRCYVVNFHFLSFITV